MLKRSPETITTEHDPSLNPENEDHLDIYEGFDNPLDIVDWRNDFRELMEQKRAEVESDPDVRALTGRRRATKIERISREELREELEDELISYILNDPYFDSVSDEDFDAELEDALDTLWDFITMSDSEWIGDINADGSYVGNGVYDRLSYEIYEDMYGDDEEDVDDEWSSFENILDENEELSTLQTEIDDLRDAYAKILAKPWSIKARREAKIVLGIRRPISAHALRKQLEDEWLTTKAEFIREFRDVSDEYDLESLGLDPSLTDEEADAAITSLLIRWDIDDFTELQRVKVDTMKSKAFGKLNEKLHSGSKKKRVLKYLAIGVPATALGIATGVVGGFLAPIAAATAVGARFGARYANAGAARSIADAQTLADAETASYTAKLSELDGVSSDEFEDEYDATVYDANDALEQGRKTERNARMKSVGFAAGTILLPRAVVWGFQEIPFLNDAAHSVSKWTSDRWDDWKPSKWRENLNEMRGIPSKPVDMGVNPDFMHYNSYGSAPGAPGAMQEIARQAAESSSEVEAAKEAARQARDALYDNVNAPAPTPEMYANLGRLLNAEGSTPWARAEHFFGKGHGSDVSNWLKAAVDKTPGAQWHNVGDGISTNDWISVNGRSDTGYVWEQLTTNMLKP